MEIPRELLSEFTRTLSRQPSKELPQRLCCAFAEVVGADGAAISVGSTMSTRRLLAVTDRRTEQIEDLQDMVGEGPSIRALRGDEPSILDGQPEAAKAWPKLVTVLLAHTTGHERPSLYAFPMQPQRAVLGVLTAHQADHSGLTVGLDAAQFLANAIGVAVLGDLGLADGPPERWLVRDRISHATGMVIAQLGIPADDALAVLRAHAYANNVTLSEASRRVVDRSLRFTPHNSEEGS
jgi:hypothetical protein